jgi:hypothetical protein
MTNFTTITPVVATATRSDDSERQSLGRDAQRTGKESPLAARITKHEAGTKRDPQVSPGAIEWDKLTQEFFDVHSHSLATLETGVRLGDGRRAFRAEKITSPGNPEKSAYRLVETSSRLEQLWVALFGSKVEMRKTITELNERILATNQFYTDLACNLASVDSSGNIVDRNNKPLENEDEIVEKVRNSALQKMSAPRLPAGFASGDSYHSLVEQRRNAIANAIVSDLLPQHAKKKLAPAEASSVTHDAGPKIGLPEAAEIFRGTVKFGEEQGDVLRKDFHRFFWADPDLHWRVDGEDLVKEKGLLAGKDFSAKNKAELADILRESLQERIEFMSGRNVQLAKTITLVLTQPARNAMIDVAGVLAGNFTSAYARSEQTVNLRTDSSGNVRRAQIDMEINWDKAGEWLSRGEIPVGSKATIRASCELEGIELEAFYFRYEEPSGHTIEYQL